MNSRRLVVEDRVLDLADDLHGQGQVALAARLRGTVPDFFGSCDEHVPLLREALHAVVVTSSGRKDAALRVLSALDDLPAAIGRRGRVWVGTSGEGAYSAYWEDEDWLEQGPEDVPLSDALAWASARSDDVRGNFG